MCEWFNGASSYTLVKAEVLPQATDGGLQSWVILISDPHLLPLGLPQAARPGRNGGADLTALLVRAGTDSGQTGHLREEQEVGDEHDAWGCS